MTTRITTDLIADLAVTTAKQANSSVTSGKLVHPVEFVQGTNIASASTTNLAAATGNVAHITGTTTINSFGTVQAGALRWLTFDGALTITYNATSMILPSAASITTAAGDGALFVSEGSGNWRCLMFSRANGRAIKPEFFTSTNQIIPAAGGLLTVAHGLSGRPDFVQLISICTTAASNYSIGDTQVVLDGFTNAGSSIAQQIYMDDNTNINIRAASLASLTLGNKTTGAIGNPTTTSFAYIVKAIRF